MPPRLNLFTARAAVFRPASSNQSVSRRSITSLLNANRSSAASPSATGLKSCLSQTRYSSSDSKGKDDAAKVPEEPLPHVSEEAAEVAHIMNKKCDGSAPASPELEQGTPISEIFKRDTDAQKYAPKVLKDQSKGPSGTRSFSTSTRRTQANLQGNNQMEPAAAMVASMISQVNQQAAELNPGLKFPAPESLPRTENFRTRYDTLLDQFTKQLMRDGKLATAQRNMSFILDHLRTSSPPQVHAKRRLLGSPSTPQLPMNPVLYLTLIIDSVAPVIKLRQQKGIAGGGASVPVPFALNQRQRRRQAIRWIIDASDKRRDSSLAQRVANELVSVAEGRSGVWERREHTHKMGVAGRANVGLTGRK
ncbi:mitochondrial 37S ribosomal protein uS7m [Aspergillus candidus]|uniref:Small ribosomal subunit protein uS7m n=1 Tax=Aspergillus candidus TaxID=41067 RepID=A0A2I2FMT8_ASPCN|nr:ribosomal protein S7 domain-containing protein [Aspergillus candidus]PLB41907.1 ribosomal protein S7 domain-containing protein [Aspergillus candidus]